MLYLLVALIALGTLSVFVLRDSFDKYDLKSIFLGTFGIVGIVIACVGLVAYSICGWNYISAGYQAKIINAEYGTKYTQAEIYHAKDVINIVREIDRKRIEINGNLLQDKK